MTTILNILSLIGSLGLFLFGMKTMSEGLEKFAGDRLRSALAAMTKNRVMGVLTGILVTALIQSSSATTVMVVSFVNAGLMTLRQAIGVIMGANIGTTVTAWIIAAIGFKVNIAALALPLLSVGMIFYFGGDSKKKSIGEFIFGFAFLFMGLSFLQTSANDLEIGTIVANLLAHISGDSFFIILLFVFVGAFVTMLVQASSATMAITMMLFDMHIPGFGFQQAAALAMGQNIGTTITAFMASMTANTQARRAALAHMSFNVFGVVIALILFYPFCNFIDWVVGADGSDLYRLSAFHTAFNIFNTILLIGFVKQIETFVCKLLPQKEEEKGEQRLKYISGGLLSTAELSIWQARREISLMAERCQRMLEFIRTGLEAEKEEDFNKAYEKSEHYEQITDNMEEEIATYLGKVSEGRLSDQSKNNIREMQREVDELESIGDSMFHIERTLYRKRQNNTGNYTPKQMERINSMLKLVETALTDMNNHLKKEENISNDISLNYKTEEKINELRSDCRNENLDAVDHGEYSYRVGVFYTDVINECEKIGDYVINVMQAENGIKL